MCEEWKTINDYSNYSISNFGAIRNDKQLIMKLHPDKDGYLTICLTKDKKTKLFKHHQLLGIHFIPNPENYKQIDHINCIKDDNRLENLRWCNQSQNCRNKKKRTNASSQYQGVSLEKSVNKWRASIKINSIGKYLGYFNTELEAFNAWKAFVVQNNLQEFYNQVDLS